MWTCIMYFLKSLRKFPQCLGYSLGFDPTRSDFENLKFFQHTHLRCVWTRTMSILHGGPYACFPQSFRSSSSMVREINFSFFVLENLRVSCILKLPTFLMSYLLTHMGRETNFVSYLMMESSTRALLSTEVCCMDAHHNAQ